MATDTVTNIGTDPIELQLERAKALTELVRHYVHAEAFNADLQRAVDAQRIPKEPVQELVQLRGWPASIDASCVTNALYLVWEFVAAAEKALEQPHAADHLVKRLPA